MLTAEHNVHGPAAAEEPSGPGRPRRLDAVAAELAARGGELWVDRAPAKGARFTAALPAV
jgi:hypothetical protein